MTEEPITWKLDRWPLTHLSITTGQRAATSERVTSNSPQEITISEVRVQYATFTIAPRD